VQPKARRRPRLNNRGQSSFGAVAAMIEADSVQFHRHAVEFSDDLSVWTKLYTVSQTMLSAIHENKILSAVGEVCSNLLGCEEVAIVDVSRANGRVRFLAAEGISSTTRRGVAASGKALDSQIQSGNLWIVSDNDDQRSAELEHLGVSALVPLWSDEESSGAILLFKLLPQRTGFDTEDRRVLQFLSTRIGECMRSRDDG
jgi:transcriptional regulator with GAF, ATPase, and Fis domain